jgi:hypothetical protein
MTRAARSGSSGSWGQEVSTRQEEAYLLHGNTPSAKPLLVDLRKQAWKPLLCFLPFRLWGIKPHVGSGLD